MKLLATLDFSDMTDSVVAAARKLAGTSSASIVLLHVMPEEKQDIEFHPTIEPRYHPPAKYYREPDSSGEGDTVPILHNKHFKTLQNIADTLNNDGIETSFSIVHGNTVETILEQAENLFCFDVAVKKVHDERSDSFDIIPLKHWTVERWRNSCRVICNQGGYVGQSLFADKVEDFPVMVYENQFWKRELFQAFDNEKIDM